VLEVFPLPNLRLPDALRVTPENQELVVTIAAPFMPDGHEVWVHQEVAEFDNLRLHLHKVRRRDLMY